MNRRAFVFLVAVMAPLRSLAQGFRSPADSAKWIAETAGGATPEKTGIDMEMPQIAENGNAVPLHVRVASPMTPDDHVKAIHVFAERNPRPRVATFHLGPDAGRADVSTRVRLGGTQNVTVLAELSGGRWRVAAQNVLVTTGACLDEGSL
jgi:sulfur-oxidizing protein SoxY